MDTVRSIVLFLVAAVAEIGGAWLVWQGVSLVDGSLAPSRSSSTLEVCAPSASPVC